MNQLNEKQLHLVKSLVTHLADIRGIVAVVLGRSHARGRALPASDEDGD